MNKIQTRNVVIKYLLLLTATGNAFPFEVSEMVIANDAIDCRASVKWVSVC